VEAVTEMGRRIYVDTVGVDTHHVVEEQLGGQARLDLGKEPRPKRPAKKKPKSARTETWERPQFAFAFLEGQRSKKGRVTQLRVVQERCGTFEPVAGLPAGGRAECKTGPRPCPYVRCKHHLWLLEGRDRAGRRGRGTPPGTTLEPRWLDPEPCDSCELDVSDRAGELGETLSITAIGKAMGRDDSTVALLIERALQKLRDAGVEVGELLGEDEA
jgi:hypothetical protein